MFLLYTFFSQSLPEFIEMDALHSSLTTVDEIILQRFSVLVRAIHLWHLIICTGQFHAFFVKYLF